MTIDSGPNSFSGSTPTGGSGQPPKPLLRGKTDAALPITTQGKVKHADELQAVSICKSILNTPQKDHTFEIKLYFKEQPKVLTSGDSAISDIFNKACSDLDRVQDLKTRKTDKEELIKKVLGVAHQIINERPNFTDTTSIAAVDSEPSGSSKLNKNKPSSKEHLGIKRAVFKRQHTAFTLKRMTTMGTLKASAVTPTTKMVTIAKSYDKLAESTESLNLISANLNQLVFDSKKYIQCKHIIIGSGDAGTTLWLENFRNQHKKTKEHLEMNEIPPVIMIGNSMGSWRHDYTLAQPATLLERASPEHSSPEDFTTRENYTENSYTNARHLFQSNVINLATTEAPLLNAKITTIQKRENHVQEWEERSMPYRVQIKDKDGNDKWIYTENVEICAGLGSARSIFPGDYMTQEVYDKITKFDEEQKFTPFVDGNAFMLTDQEEHGVKRTIFISGGGGNATACFRKGFFGDDQGSGRRKYDEEHKKNDMLWMSRDGFDTAGYGTLAKNAILYAQDNKGLIAGDLRKIEYNEQTKKMTVIFAEKPGMYAGDNVDNDASRLVSLGVRDYRYKDRASGKETVVNEEWFKIECDQYVYSVGQDPSEILKMCGEIIPDTTLNTSVSGAPMGMRTSDDKVHIFGAAASAIGGNAYNTPTREWIKKNQISADGEWPGVMPPSRAQIVLYASKANPVDSASANVDDVSILKALFLKGDVKENQVDLIIKEILSHRQDSVSGMSNETLKGILYKYDLTDEFVIKGHGHISIRQRH